MKAMRTILPAVAIGAMVIALTAILMLSGCKSLQTHKEIIYILNQQDPTPGLSYQIIAGPVLNHMAWGLTEGVKSGQVIAVEIEIVDQNNSASWFYPLDK